MSTLPSSPVGNTIIRKKNPLYPLNVPVSVMYTDWKYPREGVITFDTTGFGYIFTPTLRRYKGVWRSLQTVQQITVLSDGKVWDRYDRV